MARQTIDIDVLGDKALSKRLGQLDILVQRKIVREALRKGGRLVLDEVKRMTPRDSGRLVRSIKLRAIKPRRGRFGVRVETGTRAELDIGSEDRYYYPAVLEYGSRNVKPQRFMRNAANRRKPAFLSAVRFAIESAVRTF